ncbi:unnamed protein product [Cylicostephanus goldi]|uniref:Uncharacterized protein n=1 Tax=Cylicostephanus goldi TaxID=71465 RepID=A0A3P7N2D7_CYLGO|nr:unnamed protein product [Cylicostephanus goldi]
MLPYPSVLRFRLAECGCVVFSDVVTHRKQLDDTIDIDGLTLDRLIDNIENYPGDGVQRPVSPYSFSFSRLRKGRL